MGSLKKIALILLLIFLLPAIFFSAYEISSLSQDEEVINQIYQNQLDAILYSANQYSDDVLNGWISKIQLGLEESKGTDTIPGKINQLLMLNPALTMIFIGDTLSQEESSIIFSLEDSLTGPGIAQELSGLLKEENRKINQLIVYQRSGFQKVEPLSFRIPRIKDFIILVFILEDHFKEKYVCGLVIEPNLFIEELLGPRLQVIAKDQFVLSAYKKDNDNPIYLTSTNDSISFNSVALTKDFWLLPDYYLGISTMGNSIQDLVNERTSTNLVLILVLDAVLILGVWLVFANVKREVQLAQNKSDFVSNVSHEIRTPLALIGMFAETLELGRVKSEKKKQEYYSIIHKETNRLTGIVNRILNFSRMEANKKILKIEPVDLDDTIREVLSTYEFHLQNKGFTYELRTNLESKVYADQQALVEVIVNLMDNAIKYSPTKKHIEIMTGRQNNYGFLVVKDHGVGISKHDQKHVFDKFYRVSSGDLAKSKGTGLGLSLVKEIMENHQGKIDLKSEPGKGSSFYLYFPISNVKERAYA